MMDTNWPLRSLERTLLKRNTTGKSLASFKVWADNHIYAIHLLISVHAPL